MNTRLGVDFAIDSIDDALLAVVRVLSQGRVHEQILRDARVDITRADSALLYTLHTTGDCVRLGDLADRLGVDAPTVTRRVQQLEGRGLLRRSSDPDDRRAQRVHLTANGKRTIERLMVARRCWLERLLEPWSAADRQQFGRGLAEFAAAINTYVENADGH